MNIEQLTSLGGVVSAAPVRKTITWEREGESGEVLSDTFDVFVRKLAYADQERVMKLSGLYDRVLRAAGGESDDDSDLEDGDSLSAATIVVALRLGENGEERLTYEQACRLEPSLAQEFVKAINEVNPTPRKKPSAQPTKSGTSLSSTASADAP